MLGVGKTCALALRYSHVTITKLHVMGKIKTEGMMSQEGCVGTWRKKCDLKNAFPAAPLAHFH